MIRTLSLIISILGLSALALLIYFPSKISLNDSSEITPLIQNQNVEISGQITDITWKREYTLINLDNSLIFRTSNSLSEKDIGKFVEVRGIIKEYGKLKYLQAFEIRVI